MIGVTAGLASSPVLLAAAAARAGGQTPKSDVGYQYTPKGEQRCGLCASFIPGVDPSAVGACRIVAGPIPQNGWCQLWAKR
jgi:hypothetical protein